MGARGCTSLIRADRILTHVAQAGAASYTQLLNDLGLPKSSLLCLLDVMCECGLLVKNENRQYQLGIRLYELGCRSLHRRSLFEATKRPMQELSLTTGLICHLGSIEESHAIYIDKVESPNSTPTGKSWIGKVLSLHSTALGKALLAWKPEEELTRYLDRLALEKFTEKTIIDRTRFVEELALTRRRGWAIDDEESAPGAVCLSMPVFDLAGRVSYAVSLSANPTVYTKTAIPGYLKLLAACSLTISRGLGWSGPMPQVLA